jgi:hypothetical protein
MENFVRSVKEAYRKVLLVMAIIIGGSFPFLIVLCIKQNEERPDNQTGIYYGRAGFFIQ